VTYFYNLGPFDMYGKGEARDFELGVWTERQVFKPKTAKVGQKGRRLRYVTYFYNFGTPLYLWNG